MYFVSALHGQATSAWPGAERRADRVQAGHEVAGRAGSASRAAAPMRVMIRMLTTT